MPLTSMFDENTTAEAQAQNVWASPSVVPLNSPTQDTAQAATLQAPKRADFSTADYLGAIFGGPGVAESIIQRKNAQALVPLTREYLTRVNKALLANDFDTAEALSTDFEKYAGMSQQALALQQRVVDKINKDRESYTGVMGVAKIFKDQAVSPEQKAVVNVIEQNPRAFTPASALDVLKTAMPKVSITTADIQRVQPITGRAEIEPRDQLVEADKLPKSIENAIIASGITTPQNYATLRNKVVTGKATDLEKEYDANLQKLLVGPSGLATRFQALEHAPRGMEQPPTGEQVQQYLFGTPGAQPSGQPTTQPSSTYTPSEQQSANERQLQLTGRALGIAPQAIQNAVGHFRQESSSGVDIRTDPKLGYGSMGLTNNRGPEGQPGTADRAAAMLSKKLGRQVTGQQVMEDPTLNQAAGLVWADYLLKKNKGDSDKAIQEYNPGDPNYLRDVKSKLGEVQAQTTVQRAQPTVQPTATQAQPTQPSQAELELERQAQALEQRANTPGISYGDSLNLRDQAQKLRENAGRLTAERLVKPPGEELTYMKFEGGKLQGYSGPLLSRAEMQAKGYAGLPHPQAVELQKTYAALEGKYELAMAAVDALPTDAKSDVYRVAGRIIASGAEIPVLGRLIPSSAGLGRAEMRALTMLTAYGQATERFINDSGGANANVGAVKDSLVGYFSGPGSAKATLEDIKALQDATVRERLHILNPASVGPEISQAPAKPASWESTGDPLGINAAITTAQQALQVPEKLFNAEGRAELAQRIKAQYDKIPNPPPGTIDALANAGIKAMVKRSTTIAGNAIKALEESIVNPALNTISESQEPKANPPKRSGAISNEALKSILKR